MIDEVIIADHAFFHKNGCLYGCDQCKNFEYNDRPVKWWYRGKFIGDSYDGFTELDFSTWKKFKAFI